MMSRREPAGEFVWLPHLPYEVVEAHHAEMRERRERSPAAQLERTRQRLDQIDLEIAGLRRIQVAETRERLRRLGIDVSGYTLPPLPRPIEQRSRKTQSQPDTASGKTTRRPDEQRTLKHYLGGYVTAIR
jgi:hypothetical protein